MESSHAIRFDIIDIFAIITLSNPKKFNALSQESYTQLANFLREADQNEGVYITLLIGEGSFFSA
jgi:peroxisomal 3,2-trans-enoyl-CoA isomerase